LGVLLSKTLGSFLIWALALLYLSAILYFFFKKRHYLSIGLILFVTLIPAIVGGCLFIILR
jgi:4-hydroxybenzoate polyprenyltransferase